eukprot:CAMPEP_0196768462 /NCGR_PEP_ID=MMETSP1095-20130614/42795_1 /TAXON_ID=96789 ORGANISM="Chromulina nebulosa, Strain UTEXLB2642" /NCGR_SAMPLE_ID=MMETSP1095 /ASSEMBLY_ACC=CAM_ASM_000446 /LENGTH=1571 /DNA_ID=CAMNT_0042138109 /DNA_START=3776 /DNA_END=8494 /DNA_ORIENTATION=-
MVRKVIDSDNQYSKLYYQVINELRSGSSPNINYGDLSDYLIRQNDGSLFEDNRHKGSDDLDIYLSPNNRFQGTSSSTANSTNLRSVSQKYAMNQVQLSRSWDVSQRSTASDWYEWLRRLKIELIRESPSPVIRSCASLAQTYPPLANDLFHAAFVSCWQDLTANYQASLVNALQSVFMSSVIPPEILQTLLNLAEFMEHDVEALPISLSVLAELAQKSRAYAKALHYRELEFKSSPASCFEMLININKKLDQYDAAVGVVNVVNKLQLRHPELRNSLVVQDSWLTKLGYWEEALAKYENRLLLNEIDAVAITGKLKCLEALGRWEEAIDLCTSSLNMLRVESDKTGSNMHTKVAVIGARAAWSLCEWDVMDKFTSNLSYDNVDGTFMRAVLATHRDEFLTATTMITKTRKLLDSSISTLLAESYGRAYFPLIMVQQCSELEEIAEYKKILCESNSLTSGGVISSRMNTPIPTNGTHFNKLHIPKNPCPHLSINQLANSEIEVSGNTPLVEVNNILQNQINKHKYSLADKWRKRLRGCYSSGQAAIPYWKYLLNGRRLILKEREDLDTWLEFSSLCRNTGNLKLAERLLNIINDTIQNSSFDIDPADFAVMNRKIRYALAKQQWSVGNKVDAILGLESLIKSVLPPHPNVNQSDSIVQVNCILKLGQWKLAMIEPGIAVDSATRKEVLGLYQRATTIDPLNYSAWHQWGLSNYRAIEEAKGKSGKFLNSQQSSLPTMSDYPQQRVLSGTRRSLGVKVPFDILLPLIVNSLKGLLRAISLGTKRWSSTVMQDMLCVLSLWFKYGQINEIKNTLENGLSQVHVDNWLGVLPQLIARIDHPEVEPRNLLHSLIIQLGKRHAQALVYNLSVAIKSPRQERIAAAESLIGSLRQHSAQLIDQAVLVSQELVRVAIVWEELWHESLEEASRQYFGDGNVQAMIDTLSPLNNLLEAGPQTHHEASFSQLFGRELSQAWSFIKKYRSLFQASGKPIPTSGAAPKKSKDSSSSMKTIEEDYLHNAWEKYYSVFQSINKRLTTTTILELQYCSPALLHSKDMILGIPGTYTVAGKAVRIRGFESVVGIIKSKQRPRKIKILGEDGRGYVFLLKGHEDLRQDERAMQLFGLVNALLVHDRRTSSESHNLTIERYAVIPLSPTAGLISWVPNCDTMHDLIKEYRDSRSIIINVEHRLMQQLSPPNGGGYDTLTMPQKLEIFEFALNNTTGEDLAKILWLKSDTSEAWLQRRLNYTKSLAVMSMVGYILGLGDRHPSNLMLDRNSGKVLHIDFGDCFEVAVHRDKFPEQVPFRLTRMLVNAMEVSGVEGTFRLTCEKVMSMLRENRDSLVATLEAFVYDPLISWRLLNPKDNNGNKRGAEFDKSVNKYNDINTNVVGGMNELVPEDTINLKDNNSNVKYASDSIDRELSTIITRLDTVQEESEVNDEVNDSMKDITFSNETNKLVDLHIQMSSLAKSVTLTSASLSKRSLRQMSLAQELKYSNTSKDKSIEIVDIIDPQDELSERAVLVIRRVMDKLTGLDFNDNSSNKSQQVVLDVKNQVDRLIIEAMANENLSRGFVGWCPFW